MTRALSASRRTLVALGVAVVAVASGVAGGVAAGSRRGTVAREAAASTDRVAGLPLDVAPRAPLLLAVEVPHRAPDRFASAVRVDTPAPGAGDVTFVGDDTAPTTPDEPGSTARSVTSATPPDAAESGAHGGADDSAGPVVGDGLEAVEYDVSAAHGDAARRATSDASGTDTVGAALAAVRDALAPWPGASARLETAAALWIRVVAPPSALPAVEATLDRVAAVDGPVASILVEDLGPADATNGAVATLVLDVPWSHRPCAIGGRARVACGGLDLWVEDGGFAYLPVFDLLRDGLTVEAQWARAEGADVLRVDLSRASSFDRSCRDGGGADVEVAETVPFAPPELLGSLTEPVVERYVATMSVPATAGTSGEVDCGGRRLRITVVSVDDAIPIRRGWKRAEVRLAPSGFVPLDVETLAIVVDRPFTAGGQVAGSLDVVEGAMAVVELESSSVRAADLGDAQDASVREVHAIARSLTAPLVVHASASATDGPERGFDLRLTVAGDDVVWNPMDVPARWDTETARRGAPSLPRRILRPTVTSVVVPLRVRIGVGGEVRRTLTLDRGRGPERWRVTVVRRGPPRGG